MSSASNQYILTYIAFRYGPSQQLYFYCCLGLLSKTGEAYKPKCTKHSWTGPFQTVDKTNFHSQADRYFFLFLFFFKMKKTYSSFISEVKRKSLRNLEKVQRIYWLYANHSLWKPKMDSDTSQRIYVQDSHEQFRPASGLQLITQSMVRRRGCIHLTGTSPELSSNTHLLTPCVSPERLGLNRHSPSFIAVLS